MGTKPPVQRSSKIPISQVVEIAANEGLTVSRVTIYNWVQKGRKGKKLKTFIRFGKLYTTKGDALDFLANM